MAVKKKTFCLKGTPYEGVGDAIVSLQEIFDRALFSSKRGFAQDGEYLKAKDEVQKRLEELEGIDGIDLKRAENYRSIFNRLVDTAEAEDSRLINEKLNSNHKKNLPEISPYKSRDGEKKEKSKSYNSTDKYHDRPVSTRFLNGHGGRTI